MYNIGYNHASEFPKCSYRIVTGAIVQEIIAIVHVADTSAIFFQINCFRCTGDTSKEIRPHCEKVIWELEGRKTKWELLF